MLEHFAMDQSQLINISHFMGQSPDSVYVGLQYAQTDPSTFRQ